LRVFGDASVGELGARRIRGGITVDNVERSFAALAATSFVVLVVGIVLLAMM
jgi:hypothetical protein